MKLRSEKKMRKHLLEQLKARKVLGARIAQTKKTAEELASLEFGPQVFLFKNIFSGQVIYSQVPAYHQNQIDEQFPRPNWENRKPARRNDLWRIMAVATFENYEYAKAAYDGLVQLRRVRDVWQSDQAKAMRRKNDEGNTWYSGQYRPTYSQEAVADLACVVDEFELEGTKVDWESLWRKGDDEYWRGDLVEHSEMKIVGSKDESVLLDELRVRAVEEFKRLREDGYESLGSSGEGISPAPGVPVVGL